MKFLIQRVTTGRVTVDNETVGVIDNGYVVFIGIKKDDTKETADALIEQLLHLRIMADEDGAMNYSIMDTGGELLLVSQFTLYANTNAGRRPGFADAAPPDTAEKLYDYIVDQLEDTDLAVETGVFGAMMQVEIHNDGPVTIMLEA